MNNLFSGVEIERTPMCGELTLYVVGLHDPSTLLSGCFSQYSHFYFGANKSFPNISDDDYDIWESWTHMIQSCLDAGLWCSLDIHVNQMVGLLDSGLTEYNQFIPIVSVNMPYIDQLGYNAILKIDGETNPGVWCHSIHELKNRSAFTSWSKYIHNKDSK